MPARHISSQSFDEILSDLGDDPAIPDPHGIRKPPPSQTPQPRPSNQGKDNPLKTPFNPIQMKNLAQGFASQIIIIGLIITAAAIFFIVHSTLQNHAQSILEESQKEISALKKEVALMRNEIHQEQDDLYLALDEIEVSIHSLKDKKPEIRTVSKPQPPAHESELRRWRYLGSSQMGSSYQAHLHTGKSHLTFEKGVQVLGDWRLSNIEKGLVTLTHPQGKFLILKASKSE